LAEVVGERMKEIQQAMKLEIAELRSEIKVIKAERELEKEFRQSERGYTIR
jgi:hypothetical protein